MDLLFFMIKRCPVPPSIPVYHTNPVYKIKIIFLLAAFIILLPCFSLCCCTYLSPPINIMFEQIYDFKHTFPRCCISDFTFCEADLFFLFCQPLFLVNFFLLLINEDDCEL